MSVNELTAERAFLAARTALSKAERGPLVARFCVNELAAETRDRGLCVVVRAMPSLKGHVAADNDRADNVEARVFKTVEKMFELRKPLEVLSRTVDDKHLCAAGVFDAEFVLSGWSLPRPRLRVNAQ